MCPNIENVQFNKMGNATSRTFEQRVSYSVNGVRRIVEILLSLILTIPSSAVGGVGWVLKKIGDALVESNWPCVAILGKIIRIVGGILMAPIVFLILYNTTK
jgi:hypothetical protein